METAERSPYKVIRPASGLQGIRPKELWQYRDLFTTLAGRDVKLRYRQTALGAAWVLLQPLLAAGVFAFVFGKVAKLPSDGVPYFLFAYTGLLAWNAFANTLTRASGCLIGNAPLVSKVAFPRLILPLSTVVGVLIDFMVALGLLAVQMIVFHIAPHPGIVLLPFWLALLLMIGLGCGMWMAALAVSYRDVQYVLPVLIQILMYASPVAYAVSAVPTHLRTLYFMNPLSGLLEGFRWSILGHGQVSIIGACFSTAFALFTFLAGAYAFKQMERRFADVI